MPAGHRDEQLDGPEGHFGPALEHGQRRWPDGGGRPPGRVRRGPPGPLRQARACSSTSSGRLPWSRGATAPPGTSARRSPEQQRARVVDPVEPPSPISKRPTSPVGPNRCLTARRRRSEWWRSPSNTSTVSTRCSRARGPARSPVLGHLADQHHGGAPLPWPTAVSRSAQARTWARDPGAPGDGRVGHGLDGVDDHQVGPGATRRPRGRPPGPRWPTTNRPAGTGPEAPARARTWAADSSADTSTTVARPPVPRRGQHLEEEGRLAHPRLTEDQGHRAGQQAPAEHPVDLADPGRHRHGARRVDRAEGDDGGDRSASGGRSGGGGLGHQRCSRRRSPGSAPPSAGPRPRSGGSGARGRGPSGAP